MNREETIKLDNIWIDVVKAINKITNNDSEKVQSMAESIKEINKALKSSESDQLLYTNALVCSRFPEIIFAQNSGIIEVSKEAMKSQPLSIQSDSLKAIGILLYKAVLAEKALQTAQEAGKIVINRAVNNLMILDSFGLRQP